MSTVAKVALLLSLVLLLALSACVQAPEPAQPLPTQNVPPTSEPVVIRPTPAAPGPVVDDWSRIKAAKTMLFASSLDNAPFDMYNPQFQPDGFDIALATELGKRMGVQSRFKDYAFDGLLNALQLNKADAVISSLAITKERQEQADFSRSYYRGDDGILAAPDSPITEVKTKADVASKRVGVQRASVYESFIQKNLVDTKEMPATNLQSYDKMSDAISDLKTGRIDLVILDRLPADTYVSGGQAKLVGHSMYMQDYGIAVRRGSTLLPELNQALAELVADGTVDKLAEEYLNLQADQVLPLPTPAPTPIVLPTAAPTPTPAPYNWADYVPPDLTLDDHNHTAIQVVQPGQALKKGWRFQNTGTIEWSPDYKLDFASGDRMGGQAALMGQPVAIQATKDIYVNLVAPQAPGTYTGYWQMKDAAGKGFGDKVYVQITVAGPPTAVPPPPTAVPAPGLPTIQYLNANPTNIQAGSCTTLSWNVQGAYCRIALVRNGNAVQDGLPANGSKSDCPGSGTSTYELQAFAQNNCSTNPAKRQVVVQVQGTTMPTIDYLNANPTSINEGDCTTLSWNVQGPYCRIALTRNGNALQDGLPANGSKSDCPSSGSKTYELQAFAQNNCSSNPVKRQAGVEVHSKQPPPCQPKTIYADDRCGETQNMQVCDTLVVKLKDQAGTGYEWQLRGYDNHVVVSQGGGSPQCDQGIGASCTFRFQFGGSNSGSTTIEFVNKGPSGDTDHCNFPVNVR